MFAQECYRSRKRMSRRLDGRGRGLNWILVIKRACFQGQDAHQCQDKTGNDSKELER